MLRNALSRGCGLRVPLYSSYHTSASKLCWGGQEKGYKYVNPDEPGMSFTELTDRAAGTLFWTELFRGELFIWNIVVYMLIT